MTFLKAPLKTLIKSVIFYLSWRIKSVIISLFSCSDKEDKWVVQNRLKSFTNGNLLHPLYIQCISLVQLVNTFVQWYKLNMISVVWLRKRAENLNPFFFCEHIIFLWKKYTIDRFIYLIVNILYFLFYY